MYIPTVFWFNNHQSRLKITTVMSKSISRCLYGPLSFKAKKSKISLSMSPSSTYKPFSHDAFVEDYAKRRVELSILQRALLAAGSATISITNPYRGDMIACLGETTGETALNHCLRQMMASEEGQRILNDKPRINTATVDLDYLKSLPAATVGKTYSDFLENNKVSPDDRPAVQFVDDLELAYVMQRYREVHDIFHAMLLMPTTMLGEVAVKWVEGLQLKLPMCVAGAIFGAARLKPKQRYLYLNYHLPWAIQTGKNAKFLLAVYFEERWEQPLLDFHKEMNIKRLV
ncbi:ubiquinone biosynthesis protein COQ4 homolog, mitochondrial-like isoform X2 [Phymastichus coffea]|uniref:ubiquinone biosynthesis protein COQ4 homolog, mitochondrial-like isoform X2 n=1 Tax=Phymastichus coffea TaxID=108790 RepID=UPI00273AF48A|nr:ubiquinone biosynthesis protein COQ4 homolog, mitochondrial-like isoform X2 [Phymastichus coffea]XP_058797044.1 ubiquinone biosynthesis protein COQ4 homolog, mitochondrial-like isoform X2 [Phymastichus coffea]